MYARSSQTGVPRPWLAGTSSSRRPGISAPSVADALSAESSHPPTSAFALQCLQQRLVLRRPNLISRRRRASRYRANGPVPHPPSPGLLSRECDPARPLVTASLLSHVGMVSSAAARATRVAQGSDGPLCVAVCHGYRRHGVPATGRQVTQTLWALTGASSSCQADPRMPTDWRILCPDLEAESRR